MKTKTLIGFLTIIITTMIVGQAFTQEILSVTPSSGFVGETAYPQILCNNTQLVSDFDYIEIGDPTLVQVISAEVQNNYELQVILDISPLAEADELLDITIYLNNGSNLQMQDAFLLKAVGDFEVMLTVIPTDPLYLSSFDPDAPENSPFLFSVQLMNEWKNLNAEDELRVEFIIENPEYGELGGATKYFDMGLPEGLPYTSFDNRDFDEYNINSGAMNLIDQAMQTGILPPGTYIYYVNVYAGDSLIGNDEGINVTENMITSIDLIGPGNPLDFSPQEIYTPTPYFLWFSFANYYDFALYEVLEGQTTADEITSNLAEFEATDLGTTEFLYPTYAELLIVGKTYAWQVTAYFEGSMGLETIYSNVFWFSYKQGDETMPEYIVVNPGDVTINTSESYQFTAIGYDANNDTIQINPEWHVIPSSAGTIDENGLFNATNIPGAIAVVGTYNGLQSYSTVTIQWENSYFDMENLIKQVFGIN